jgi:hypothetical protein
MNLRFINDSSMIYEHAESRPHCHGDSRGPCSRRSPHLTWTTMSTNKCTLRFSKWSRYRRPALVIPISSPPIPSIRKWLRSSAIYRWSHPTTFQFSHSEFLSSRDFQFLKFHIPLCNITQCVQILSERFETQNEVDQQPFIRAPFISTSSYNPQTFCRER